MVDVRETLYVSSLKTGGFFYSLKPIRIMEKLFNDSETYQKERPSIITEEQKEEVFKEAAKDIKSWNLCDIDIESIAYDLSEVYDQHLSGYELAKEIEDDYYGYTINSSLIEILESLESSMSDKKRQNIIEWAKAHNIKPKIEKGSELKLISAPFFSFKVGDVVYITSIREETAQYVIHKDPLYQGGTLIDYEKLEKCI